jgi:hypothetical protein
MVRGRLAAGVVVVVVVIVTTSGCGSPTSKPRSETRGSVPARTSTGTRAKDLSARLILDSTQVRPGTPIQGTLVVTNPTGNTVGAAIGCAISYEVVLTSPSYHPMIAWPASCAYNGQSAIAFHPGVTRMAMTVLTTYLACFGQQAPGSTTPTCGSGGQLPPLPAGVYFTELVGSGDFVPPCPPVKVTLLNPS